MKRFIIRKMMKKSLFLLLLCVPFGMGLFAQGDGSDWRQTFNRHEFSLAVGDPTMANRARMEKFSVNTMTSWLDIPTYTDVYTSAPITVGYRFRLLKWLWLGGDITYCGFFGTSRNIYTEEPVYKYRENSVSIMPSIRFSYLNREHVTLYSGFTSGLRIGVAESYNEKDAFVRLPFQVTLFGVSAGSQSWFGFAELGVGFQGFAKAGFGYRFNGKKRQ